MRVDHVGALPRRQREPIPAVIQLACTGIEFGDQFGYRAGLTSSVVEPRVVDLQEDPLRPLVELDVGGGEASPVVVAETQSAQLAPEIDDVGLGAGARVSAGLHRVLLGGQTERVETQRVQHIAAQHPEVAGVDIGGDVAERMADVQTLTRGIREHVLHEHLGARRLQEVGAVRRRQRTDRIGHVESPQPGPIVLPGAFDPAGQVRGIAKTRRVGIGLLGRGGRGVGHAQQVIRAASSDPPTIDGLVWIADRSGVCPRCVAGRFQRWKPPFPLVTVAFCDLDNEPSDLGRTGPS